MQVASPGLQVVMDAGGLKKQSIHPDIAMGAAIAAMIATAVIITRSITFHSGSPSG
ncbi:MAG: hypothetical protein AAF282_12040 [Cyanobacteria bacterium P01_A01_bin.15]